MSTVEARKLVVAVINENGWIEPGYTAGRWAIGSNGYDEELFHYYRSLIGRIGKDLYTEGLVKRGDPRRARSMFRYYKPRGNPPIS